MPTAEKAYQNIINLIEENRLEDAVAALLSFAGQYSPDRVTAVRMRRSDWKKLAEETLMMGEVSSIRERRSTLKLQLFRLADAIHKDASIEKEPSESITGNELKRNYNTGELYIVFRKGDTEGLLQQLIGMAIEDGHLYDQVLLLEQRWKAVCKDEKNNTASLESITIRKNKLNQDILYLIRGME